MSSILVGYKIKNDCYSDKNIIIKIIILCINNQFLICHYQYIFFFFNKKAIGGKIKLDKLLSRIYLQSYKLTFNKVGNNLF